MFANLTYEDKQAFFSLLDEYFESRPHLLSGGSDGGAAAKAAHAYGAAAAAATLGGGAAASGTRFTRSPSHTSAGTPPYSSPSTPVEPPPSHGGLHGTGQSAAVAAGAAKDKFKAGTKAVTTNAHLNSAMGKIGAGGFMNKLNKPTSRTLTGPVPGPGEARTMPPPPPSSRALGGGGAAASSPSTAPLPGYTPRNVGAGAGGPPPVRRDMRPGGAPAEHRAQAMYDYAGGESTDLPVFENQVVTIVDKTSEDWWTCKDDTGKQGLVPATYLKEL